MRRFGCTRNAPRPLHTGVEAKFSGVLKTLEVAVLAFFEIDTPQVIIAILLA